MAENNEIWRSKFQEQKSWKYYNEDSETDGMNCIKNAIFWN